MTSGGRDHRRLRVLGALGASRFLLGDQLSLEEPAHGFPVPLRLGVRGLGLRQLGLGGGQLPLGLADAALRVGARLIHAKPALLQLLVQHGDLVLRQAHSRLGLTDGRRRLPLARANLLVVELGDDLPGLDRIALPHGDLADPP